MEKDDVLALVMGDLVQVKFVGECEFVADLDGVQVIVETGDGARFMVPHDWISCEDMGAAMADAERDSNGMTEAERIAAADAAGEVGKVFNPQPEDATIERLEFDAALASPADGGE